MTTEKSTLKILVSSEQTQAIMDEPATLKQIYNACADNFEESYNAFFNGFMALEDVLPVQESLCNEVTDHFLEIEGFIKGIRWAGNCNISTKDIIKELSSREGVEKTIVPPYKDGGVSVNGPAIILKIID